MKKIIIIVLLALPLFLPFRIFAMTPASLDVGLVGHWTFDGKDMVQNVADSSGQGNNGNLVGYTSTTTVAGKIGQALGFNGTSQYVDVSTVPTASNPLSVSAWVYPTSFSQSSFGGGVGGTIIDENEGGGSAGWLLGINNSNRIWFWPSGGGDRFSTNTVPINKWTHVVATYDGTNLLLYINGTLDSTQTMSAPHGSATFFRVGARSWITGFWKGSLDDVRIYNRALSTAEIAQLYRSTSSTINKTVNIPNIDNGIVGHWTFDGKDMVQNVADSSGQGNNGNLVGYTSTTTVAGKIGQALSFNGTSQYVRSNTTNNVTMSGSSLTIGLWLYLRSTPTYGVLINKGTNNNSMLWDWGLLFTSGGGDLFLIRNGSNLSPTGIVIPQNQWVFITATISDTQSLFYLNGVLKNSQGGVGIGATNNTLGRLVEMMGAGSNQAGSSFVNGQLDDVRIYNRALSTSEITQLYRSTSSTINKTVNIPNIDNGIVGHWTFDGKDMVQNVADSSGQGNNGNLVGYTSTTTVAGKIGQALGFNGVNQYVDAGNNVNVQLGTGSVSAWIKTTNAGTSYRGIVTKQFAYGMFLNDNVLMVFDWSGNANRSTGVNLADNKWHLVTLTFNSGVANGTVLYIDGVARLATQMTIASQTTPVQIGWANAGGQYFAGNIDDVRIYNRVLSATEVKQLYKSNAGTLK
jgi:hypothetical protein